ncbi:thioredoxin family protein [Desulforhopalus sp. IMCC35007]|uniref:thioredoxin family protein n=1 Tax=Desulforhopalus sp. IMCC35007 TaxID=2569543 RepID=UPI00352A575C
MSVKNLLNGVILFTSSVLILVTSASVVVAKQHLEIPVSGMVTMVDLGAKKCIPCKMMAPIMEELEAEYKGRAAIVFIDVWENPNAGNDYGISLIPTQIFYDAKGNEVLRHEGFYDKASIISELTKLGVK